MSKSRKSLSSWQKCEQCQCVLTQKDFSLHEKNCPPSTENWKYCFIIDGVLYNTKAETLELQELPEQISEKEANGMVFISLPSLQLCDIAIGSPVVVETANEKIVQTAWPTNGKSLTSVSLTKHAIELNNITGPVKVYSLTSKVDVAEEIVIDQQGKRSVSDQSVELDYILKFYNEHKILTVGNKLSVPFYGRKLTYKIVRIRADTSKKRRKRAVDEHNDLSEAFENISLKTDSTDIIFYKALYSTKWTIKVDNTSKNEDAVPLKTYSTEDIGGYDSLVSDIRDVISIGIGKYKRINCLFEHFDVNRGVILHGPTGSGKSMIAQAVIAECGVQTFTVCSSNIYSKTINETEDRLKEVFKNAIANAPSVILFEDIDTVCPRRDREEEEPRPLERRILAQVTAFFDTIQRTNSDVFAIATTTKLDSVNRSLTRPGRFDMEFEIYVPNPNMRREILTKLLSKIPNTLSHLDVERISFDTHGFVGADLYGLCSKAVINAARRQKDLIASHDEPKVAMIDLQYALTVTKPSAIKEITVQIPNVKWSDIGGQKELKDLLIKAVVWPLKHPEKFERMNTAPPKGVLMFGPPGCSKTMIAKALATEIKVNFLNIRGPELFSKWVGESEKAVRKVFQMARQVAPSIIFIDEIDALGSERDSSSTTVQERVLAQLLIELDGVTALRNVTLVAATNRPDKIDKALLRPGRFDSIIYVKLPDEQTRREIFDINLRRKPVADHVDIENLVCRTDGHSGAEVQLICNAAAMKALEEDAVSITQEHFEAALKTVVPRTPASLLKIYEDFMSKNKK